MKFIVALILFACSASAQLTVTVLRVQIVGQKAVMRLEMKNEFQQKIESARAAAFLLDEKGKMVAQGTRWVIGGDKTKPGLAPGGTNTFHFVLTSAKPLTTTNLTLKVTFNRIVMEGGRLADPVKEVRIH